MATRKFWSGTVWGLDIYVRAGVATDIFRWLVGPTIWVKLVAGTALGASGATAVMYGAPIWAWPVIALAGTSAALVAVVVLRLIVSMFVEEPASPPVAPPISPLRSQTIIKGGDGVHGGRGGSVNLRAGDGGAHGSGGSIVIGPQSTGSRHKAALHGFYVQANELFTRHFVPGTPGQPIAAYATEVDNWVIQTETWLRTNMSPAAAVRFMYVEPTLAAFGFNRAVSTFHNDRLIRLQAAQTNLQALIQTANFDA